MNIHSETWLMDCIRKYEILLEKLDTLKTAIGNQIKESFHDSDLQDVLNLDHMAIDSAIADTIKIKESLENLLSQ
jgi:hypothetical protein